MYFTLLDSIKTFFFSCRQAAEALSISEASARVACHRYVRRGLLLRLKRDVYVVAERWKSAGMVQMYAAANRLQVPSYISLTTALSFYETTTQVQQNFFESIACVRTKDIEIKGAKFRYLKIQKKLYFGFVKTQDFFIAAPEKALLDALYLMALGRYRLDLAALDMRKFNRKELERLSRRFPARTQRLLEEIWNR